MRIVIFWKDYDFSKLDFISSVDGYCEKRVYDEETKKNIKIRYSETRFNLDTETTSYFILEDGSLMMFDNQRDSEFYETTKKQGLVWIWMFSINGTVLYGRNIEEIRDMLMEVQKHYAGQRLIVYIHNLSFDFEFMLNAFENDKIDIFARKSRKIIYAKIQNIDFRCSYFLTNMSLENFAKSYKLPVQKKSGDLDYNKMRTPLTPFDSLTEKEKGYCEFDCLVLDEIIKYHQKKHKSIVNIPLTQTGKIRAQINNLFYKDIEHHKKMSSMAPDCFEDYDLLCKVFQGGFTHANIVNVNQIIEDVLSFDITSSYPFEMTTKKYPMSQFVETTETLEEVEKRCYEDDEICFIVEITFNHIKAKTNNRILSYSKASKIAVNPVVDNGRLVSAEAITYILTDVDWRIVKDFYDFDENIQVHSIFTAYKDYLPVKLIKYLLSLYKDKTQYKGLDDYDVLYTEKKQFLNGCFGQACTKTITDTIKFDRNSEDLWSVEELTEETANEKIQEQKKKKGINQAFSWAPYISAYGRAHLLRVVKKLGDAECYCDTDSHKIRLDKISKEEVSKIFLEDNIEVINNIWKVIERYPDDLSWSDFSPVDKNGEEHTLGIYTCEEKIKRFRTLGAKKYACEYYTKEEYEKKFAKVFEKQKKINEERDVPLSEKEVLFEAKKELPFVKITVAGINKKTGSASLQRIEQFKENRFFDYNEAGRMEAHYNENQEEVKFPDGYVSKYKYGICLKPSTYFLNLSDFDEDLAEKWLDGGSILFK